MANRIGAGNEPKGQNMKFQRLTILSALLMVIGALALAQSAPDATVGQWSLVNRHTLAIQYPEGEDSTVDMTGTGLHSNVTGRAEAKRSGGRTRIKLRINNAPNPQGLGAFYTTYVIWAIAPEGQADNLGELPDTKFDKREIQVTTPHQTFGLIVTAEPHAMVRYPSPMLIAENTLRKSTDGKFTASKIEYRGDAGTFYTVSRAHNTRLEPDYNTPLDVLGARRSVEIARWYGAGRFAQDELKQAEVQLAALEIIWPKNRNDKEKYSAQAHDVMRLGEAARIAAVERFIAAGLAAERRAADRAVSQAQTEADRANVEADRARTAAAQAQQRAEDYRALLARNETELAQAKKQAEQAQTEAERAKAREEVARIEAERTRIENERIKRERDEAMQKLQVSLSEILEVRREARGLIVNLSDVLFDFNKASLKPGAKEKLSKLTGILLAYPGSYRIEIEGHTDSVGSDEYNMKLSQERAQSVRDYLAQAGLPADRIVATRGLGEAVPVATNDTPEGRQVNRRVEIIIADAETPPQSVRR